MPAAGPPQVSPHLVRSGSLNLNFRFPDPKTQPTDDLYPLVLDDLNNYFEGRPDFEKIKELRRQQVRAFEHPCRSPLRTVHELDPEPLEFAPDGYEKPYAGIPKRHFSPRYWLKKCLRACLKKPPKQE